MELLNKIIMDLKNNPRDLKTQPLNREGIWFYAYVHSNNIYVDTARSNTPSSKMRKPQKLNLNEFEVIYPIYLRRISGEKVSCEALEATRNQVYWFSLFKNCLE